MAELPAYRCIGRWHACMAILTLYRRLLARFAEQHQGSAAAKSKHRRSRSIGTSCTGWRTNLSKPANLGLDLLAKAAQRLARKRQAAPAELRYRNRQLSWQTACRHCRDIAAMRCAG